MRGRPSAGGSGKSWMLWHVPFDVLVGVHLMVESHPVAGPAPWFAFGSHQQYGNRAVRDYQFRNDTEKEQTGAGSQIAAGVADPPDSDPIRDRSARLTRVDRDRGGSRVRPGAPAGAT